MWTLTKVHKLFLKPDGWALSFVIILLNCKRKITFRACISASVMICKYFDCCSVVEINISHTFKHDMIKRLMVIILIYRWPNRSIKIVSANSNGCTNIFIIKVQKGNIL